MKLRYSVMAVSIVVLVLIHSSYGQPNGFCSSENADTIFIDASNTSGIEDGSQVNPFSTIQKGVTVAVPGATLIVAAGVYNESVWVNSRRDLKIIGKGNPVLTSEPVDPKFRIYYSNNIVIKGFHIYNGEEGIRILSSSGVSILNNLFEDIRQDAYGSGGAINASGARILLRENIFRNCYGGQHGGAGFITGSDLEAIGNRIIGATAWNSAGGFRVDVDSSGQPRRIHFANNIFDSCTADFSGALDIRGQGMAVVSIVQNSIRRSGGDFRAGGAINIELTAQAVVHIINNVIADVAPNCCDSTRNAITIKGAVPVTITNNVFYNTRQAVFAEENISDVSADYNNAFMVQTDYINVRKGTGNLSLDPIFANPDDGDYHLQYPASPLIDAGHPDQKFNDADGSRNDQGMYGGNTPSTSVSAANFCGLSVARGSLATVFGTLMATTSQSASSVPLPLSLAGTRVVISDAAGTEHSSPIIYVSPGQVNFQIPAAAETGPAIVTVVNGNDQLSTGHIQVDKVSPGIFSANSDGKGVPAAYIVRVRKADGYQTIEPVGRYDTIEGKYIPIPINLGAEISDQVYLVLFGTGVLYSSTVSATVGGIEIAVPFFGAAPGYTGLDQINIGPLPSDLQGSGEVEIVLTADKKKTNPVTISIQ